MIPRFDLVRAAKTSYLVSIAALLPLQNPLFSLNAIIFDYINALFMGFFIVYFVLNRAIEIRLVVPTIVILFASLISMINSEHVTLSLVTLAQELYLYVFFIVVLNVIRKEREMRILVSALCISAAAFSVPLLQELAANFNGRAAGYFTDDNGAAGFLGAIAFLAYYSFSMAGRLFRPVFLALVLTGVFATKSLSGAFSFLIGTLVIVVWYWRNTGSRTRKRILVAGIAGALLLVPVYRQAASQRNYLDRLEGSESGRASLWAAGLSTFARNPLGLGIGPAGFKEAVIVPGWSHRKELHSDYLASLVERGVFGFAGLLLIVGSIARSLSRSLKNQTTQRELLWILGLLGAFVFTLVDAISHETLHNRHVWLIYALIVAQERISTNLKRQAPGDTTPNRGQDEARAMDTSLELV